MAEQMVSYILENLGQLIIQEAALIRGAKSQVISLHDELKLINNFLENSNGKRHMVRDLVELIDNVANKAKDVVDKFFISMAKHKKRSMLAKFFYGYKHVSMLRSVALEVMAVNEDIQRVYANKERYGITDIGSGGEDSNGHSVGVDKRRRKVEEHNVVGFEKHKAMVIHKLIKEHRSLRVVSIMGMGGLGKSTLAKSVYNETFIKQHFSCRVWVYVSRESTSQDVLLNILQCVAPSVTNEEISRIGKDDEQLIKELRKRLEKKKYLIVLDSMWEKQVWDEIKEAFPDNKNDSRVLITTRNKVVAYYTSSDTPYSLPFLNKEDSWLLFKMRAFGHDFCHSELEMYGRKITEKCGGLPLAIVAAVGHLAGREKSRINWSKMADNVSLYLTREPGSCLDILALSYNEIPKDHRGLRHCFLYFGVFPENSEISTRQLIRLWIAEGFLEKEEGISSEEMAGDYLEQLEDQSLIIAVKKRSDGGIKSYRIHPLLRTFCIAQGARENLFTVHGEEVFDSQPLINIKKGRPRRLSVHCEASRYMSSIPCNTLRVHSLLYFGVENVLNTQQIRLLFHVFLRLRVLDLGSMIILSMPTQIEKLIHLRYLRMDFPTLTEIPSSISNLPALQTLDLRKSMVTFTENFWKMQQLRHLFISGASTLSSKHRQSDVKTMWNLQTLSTVSPQILNALDFEQVFPKVKKLGLHSPNGHPIFIDISKFKCVQTLKIIESCFLTTSLISQLTKITLVETQLFPTDFEILADVPNLQVLKLLRNSLFPNHLYFKEGGFPQLEVLHMVELGVQKLTIKRGALHSLQYLFINNCIRLQNVEAKSCSYKLEQTLRSLGEHIVYEF